MRNIKKLYTILLVLLGLATLCIILFTEKSVSQNGEKAVGGNGAQNGNAADESGAATTADVSTWQLYENKEAKFRFDCPGDWKVDENKDEYGNTVVSLVSPETTEAVKKEVEAMGQNYSRAESDVVVTYSASVANQTVNKVNGYGANTLSELIKKDTTIRKLGDSELNGTKTTEVIMSGEGEMYGIYIEKAGHLYEIDFLNRADKESLSETEKKILETFEVE